MFQNVMANDDDVLLDYGKISRNFRRFYYGLDLHLHSWFLRSAARQLSGDKKSFICGCSNDGRMFHSYPTKHHVMTKLCFKL